MLDSRSLACNDPPVTLHLGLAGIELIFFIVAPMVQCFGFVTQTVVKAHNCLHCCQTVPTQHQGFLRFSLRLAGEQVGVGKRTQLGQLIQTEHIIPHHIMSGSVIKMRGCFDRVLIAAFETNKALTRVNP